VGLKRGPLSLVITTEELLGRKSSGSGLENREYGRRYPSRCHVEIHRGCRDEAAGAAKEEFSHLGLV
jgi:hypothetical protein